MRMKSTLNKKKIVHDARGKGELLGVIFSSQFLQLGLQIDAFPTPRSHPVNKNTPPKLTWQTIKHMASMGFPLDSKRVKTPKRARQRERNTNQWEWAERFPVHGSESGRDDHSRWWVPSRWRRVSTAQAKMPPLSGPSPTSSSGLCFWNRPKTQTTFSKRNCGYQWHISSVAGFDAGDGILSTERENSLPEWTFSLSLEIQWKEEELSENGFGIQRESGKRIMGNGWESFGSWVSWKFGNG